MMLFQLFYAELYLSRIHWIDARCVCNKIMMNANWIVPWFSFCLFIRFFLLLFIIMYYYVFDFGRRASERRQFIQKTIIIVCVYATTERIELSSDVE